MAKRGNRFSRVGQRDQAAYTHHPHTLSLLYPCSSFVATLLLCHSHKQTPGPKVSHTSMQFFLFSNCGLSQGSKRCLCGAFRLVWLFTGIHPPVRRRRLLPFLPPVCPGVGRFSRLSWGHRPHRSAHTCASGLPGIGWGLAPLQRRLGRPALDPCGRRRAGGLLHRRLISAGGTGSSSQMPAEVLMEQRASLHQHRLTL